MFVSFLTILSSGIIWHGSARAEAVPNVVVDDREAPCAEDLTAQIIRELDLRSAAQVYSSSAELERSGWTLTLTNNEDGTCKILLAKADKSTTFVLPEDFDELQLVSIATRMAWIVDGVAPPTAMPVDDLVSQEERQPEQLSDNEITEDTAEEPTGDSDAAAEVSEGTTDDEPTPSDTEELSTNGQTPSPVPAEDDSVRSLSLASIPDNSISDPTPTPPLDSNPTTSTTDRWTRHFSVDAVGGAMWLPAADINAMMVRAQLNFKPWTNVSFGVAGRLPLGTTTWESQGMQYSYHAWSLDLSTNYSRQVSNSWELALGGGVRRSFANVSAVALTTQQDTTDQTNQNTQGQPGPGTDGVNSESQQQNHSESAVDDSFRQDDTSRAAAPQPRVTPDESPHTVHNALTPWAVTATAGSQYFITQRLAVGLEATLATNLTDRTIRDDQRLLMDLGRFELDLLLGLEWRF